MKKTLVYLCGSFLLAAACVTSAKADTFTFTFTGNCTTVCSGAESGTITITASPFATGEDLATKVTGSVNGVSIATNGLIAPNGFAGNDNIITLTTPGDWLTANGISFTLVGGTPFNLYFDPSTVQPSYDFVVGSAGTAGGIGTLSGAVATATPEPGSLMLLATGALGAVGAFRRRFTR